MAKKLLAEVVAKLPAPTPAADAEQVTQTQSGDTLEARSTSRRIKTVEDLCRHIEVDLVTKFEIEKSEATKWECASSDGDGGTTVTELHRVFVRLKPGRHRRRCGNHQRQNGCGPRHQDCGRL